MIKLIYYRHNTQSYPPAIPHERINYSEITIVLKGELQYKVNGTTVSLKDGDLVYIETGSTRQRKEAEKTDYVSFNFTSDFPVELPIFLSDCLGDIVKNIIQTFDLIFENKTVNLQDERISHLFICLLCQLKKQYASSTEPELIRKIKAYIQQNLSNKIALSDISTHVNYSVSHCTMFFKQYTGLSIVDYINKKRIILAKSLLMDRDSTLTQIAKSVGFSDPNYFSRVFKKEVGLSPLHYKNSYYLSDSSN